MPETGKEIKARRVGGRWRRSAGSLSQVTAEACSSRCASVHRSHHESRVKTASLSVT